MKFAHELKEALRREGFPPHWVESAVPYGVLKKSIKKVEAELKSLGLDAETLRHLIPSSSSSEIQKTCQGSGDAAVAFQYQFGGKDGILLCEFGQTNSVYQTLPQLSALHLHYTSSWKMA